MASRSGTEGPDLKVGLTSLLDSETRPNPQMKDRPAVSLASYLHLGLQVVDRSFIPWVQGGLEF